MKKKGLIVEKIIIGMSQTKIIKGVILSLIISLIGILIIFLYDIYIIYALIEGNTVDNFDDFKNFIPCNVFGIILILIGFLGLIRYVLQTNNK